jgi:hypothetical protein
MKITEFRIGNLVYLEKYWGDRPIQITGFNVVDRRDDQTGIYEEFLETCPFDLESDDFQSFISYKNGVTKPEDITPIPLTNEWLVKLGFVKDSFNNFSYGMSYIDKKTKRLIVFDNDSDSWFEIPVKLEFVHQLQNLYLAITNEEMTIMAE